MFNNIPFLFPEIHIWGTEEGWSCKSEERIIVCSLSRANGFDRLVFVWWLHQSTGSAEEAKTVAQPPQFLAPVVCIRCGVLPFPPDPGCLCPGRSGDDPQLDPFQTIKRPLTKLPYRCCAILLPVTTQHQRIYHSHRHVVGGSSVLPCKSRLRNKSDRSFEILKHPDNIFVVAAVIASHIPYHYPVF